MSKRIELLDRLSRLGMEEKYVKRQIDANFFDKEKKALMFERLQKVKEEAIEIKKQLSEEKRNKIENNNSN